MVDKRMAPIVSQFEKFLMLADSVRATCALIPLAYLLKSGSVPMRLARRLADLLGLSFKLLEDRTARRGPSTTNDQADAKDTREHSRNHRRSFLDHNGCA
jgi:hypothetical protein